MEKTECVLSKGEYEIIELLCITHSLLKQKGGEEEISENHMFKSVIQNKSGHFVVYFIEKINFGQGSIIRFNNGLNTVLIKNKDYFIVKANLYKPNLKLIEKLLCKNK